MRMNPRRAPVARAMLHPVVRVPCVDHPHTRSRGHRRHRRLLCEHRLCRRRRLLLRRLLQHAVHLQLRHQSVRQLFPILLRALSIPVLLQPLRPRVLRQLRPRLLRASVLRWPRQRLPRRLLPRWRLSRRLSRRLPRFGSGEPRRVSRWRVPRRRRVSRRRRIPRWRRLPRRRIPRWRIPRWWWRPRWPSLGSPRSRVLERLPECCLRARMTHCARHKMR